MYSLAVLYESMGQYARAITLCRELLATRKEVDGDKHPDYLRVLGDLAYLLGRLAEGFEQQQDFAAARKARQEVIDIRIELRGQAHWEVTDARLNLAHTARLAKMNQEQLKQFAEAGRLRQQCRESLDRGQTGDGVALLEQALALYRKVLGEDHFITADTLHWLGTLCGQLEDYTKAEAMNRQALGIRKRQLGEKHPNYVATLHNLAYDLGNKGEYTAAAVLYRQVAQLDRDISGPNSSHGVSVSKNLVYVLEKLAGQCLDRDDFATARKARQEILELKVGLYGEQPWEVTNARLELAHVGTLERLSGGERRLLREADQLDEKARQLFLQKKPREALPLAEKATDIRRQSLGEDHWLTIHALNRQAIILGALGQHSRAEPLLEKGLAARKAILGEKHPDLATSLHNLGLHYLESGNFKRAEPLLLQATDMERPILGELHADYINGLNSLAGLYRATASYGQAEPLYRKALELQKRATGENNAQYAKILANLARLYQNMGQRARAETLARQALQIRKQVIGERHPDYAQSLVLLGDLSKGRAAYAEAEDLYRQALPLIQQSLGEKHPDALATMNSLASLYKQTAAYAKAEPLFLQVLTMQREVLGEKHPDYSVTLSDLASLYMDMGLYAKAEPLYLQALAIDREVKGEKHPGYATDLNNLALLYHNMGANAKAEPLYLQALAIDKEVAGEKHDGYATALNNLACLYDDTGATSKSGPLYLQVVAIRKEVLGEKHPLYALSLHNLAGWYAEAEGDYPRAEQLYVEALAIRKAVLGEKHPDYASTLGSLAWLYKAMGQPADAEPLHRQAVAITKDALGEKHPGYAVVLNNLSQFLRMTGDFEQAESVCQEALEIRRRALGERHGDYAYSLEALANIYLDKGDFTRAEPICRRALELRKQVSGEKHHLYANDLSLLATLYLEMGDYARAESLMLQALAIDKEALGEDHPDYAIDLTSLAIIHNKVSAHGKAERLLLQALKIRQAKLSKTHPSLANNMNSLASVYLEQGDYAKAESYFRQATDIWREKWGARSPSYAGALNNLVATLNRSGAYGRAEPLAREALDIRRQALGEHHPRFAASLKELAMALAGQGDYAAAEKLTRQAVEIVRDSMNRTAAVQSERQQLASARENQFLLDAYLAIAMKADVSSETVYSQVLAWKGAVTARQQFVRAMRLAREGGDPKIVSLFADLTHASQTLATLTNQGTDPKDGIAYRRRIDELSRKIESLEKELSAASIEFHKRRTEQQRTPEDIRKALPDGAALIDFIVCNHCLPVSGEKPTWERRLVAFVLRPDRPLQIVELGKLEPIDQAVAAWRKSFGQVGANGAQLRKLIWQPLVPHLAGVRAVVISPDGPLNRLPLAALPGERPGTYLVEDLAVGVVPVPQQLPELFAPATALVTPSLLTIGDVNYGGNPGAGTVASSRSTLANGDVLRSWKSLPGTGPEARGVGDLFNRTFPGATVVNLFGDEATEQAVRDRAGKVRYLHFATHGFYDPPGLRSMLAVASKVDAPWADQVVTRQDVTGWHPGLLSGLVFTGANQKPEPDKDDGILTALELAALDLNGADLAVLSACQTAQGEVVAGGEGLLGLQRAFQTAGARTVVASLWSVDDAATQKLMTRFYENLWQKKLPKLEALRQAQLSILYDLPESSVPRGAEVVRENRADASTVRADPRLWAAWVLSGDPGDLGQVQPVALASAGSAAAHVSGERVLLVFAAAFVIAALVFVCLAHRSQSRRAAVVRS
jgi:tetratricopeptide (TPR) repeat protein